MSGYSIRTLSGDEVATYDGDVAQAFGAIEALAALLGVPLALYPNACEIPRGVEDGGPWVQDPNEEPPVGSAGQ